MKYNHFIKVYEHRSDNTWQYAETVETQHGHWAVVDGKVYVANNGKPYGDPSADSPEAAEKRNAGRYFVIDHSEPITDFVIGTFDILKFRIKWSEYQEQQFVVRVQLVNSEGPYYFINDGLGDWKWQRDVCRGNSIAELKAEMDKYFKGQQYLFDTPADSEKFDTMF